MRHLRTAGVWLACLGTLACEQGLTPTPVASAPAAAPPFILAAPAPWIGPSAPSLDGIWTGTAVFVDCRSAPPGTCHKVSPGSRHVTIDVTQRGSDVSGRFVMDGIEAGVTTFAGYVTDAGGLAGTATGTGDTRVMVRLAPAGAGLAGEVSDERWVSGSLIFTRLFVVSAPLARQPR